MSAANKVINVPELLEGILLELPLQDVLLAQRVNKTFCDVIKTSCRLQQKLFFKSAPPKDGSSAINPFLGCILARTGNACNTFLVPRADFSSAFIMRESPAIRENVPSSLRYIQPGERIEISLLGRFPFPKNSPTGSYQKMLAADPPCVFGISRFDDRGLGTRLRPRNVNEVLTAVREYREEIDASEGKVKATVLR